jgi:hypothetical protein
VCQFVCQFRFCAAKEPLLATPDPRILQSFAEVMFASSVGLIVLGLATVAILSEAGLRAWSDSWDAAYDGALPAHRHLELHWRIDRLQRLGVRSIRLEVIEDGFGAVTDAPGWVHVLGAPKPPATPQPRRGALGA